MGRPPSFDKTLVTKKVPWTPEEDIRLASYLQQHGVGNWRAVSTNTGLGRCGKSCRSRWINYLRPGIKRGNFTQEEADTIIRFQALFGNKWASIAKYLPQRTDNDIKNYWNTHLRGMVNEVEGQDGQSTINSPSVTSSHVISESSNNALSSYPHPFVGSSSSDGVVMSRITSPKGYSLDDMVNHQQPHQTRVFDDQYNHRIDLASEMQLTFLEKWFSDDAAAKIMNN